MEINMDILLGIAYEAGEAIMQVYENEADIGLETKSDDSPLTLADKRSNDIIVAGLQQHYANIPIISEETKLTGYETRKNWNYCWLVDPLDGTKEFIKRNGEFTVNIALVENGRPVLGVIYVPVQRLFYYAAKGVGSYRMAADEKKEERISAAPPQTGQTIRIVASRSHLNDETRRLVEERKRLHPDAEIVSAGSSLKFCLVASGEAHLYPRYAPTMEWDTAAGHIIAQEAGAKVSTFPDGGDMLYNKPDLLNPYFLVEAQA